MRVVLAPIGTRGDVQPLIALGLALRERGHSIVLAAPADNARWACELGIPFVALGPDLRPRFRHYKDGGALLVREIARDVGAQFQGLLRASRGADAIVGANLQLAGPSISELLGVPYHYVLYSPQLTPSLEQPFPGLPWEHPPRWISWPLTQVWPLLWELYFGRAIGRERRSLGLPPVRGIHRHVLFSGRLLLALDGALAAVPEALARAGAITGPWFLDDGTTLGPEPERFLASGPPPVYFGFGSMPARDSRALVQLFAGAARRAGVRAVITSGWSGARAARTSPEVLVADALPHGALFPRVAAVVHHGGAGTVFAAARAGVPQVVVPHFADQYYWAHRVRRSGLGVGPISRVRLSEERLARAIGEVTASAEIRRHVSATRARLLGARGIDEAVRVIEGREPGEKVGPPAAAMTPVAL